MKFIQPEDFSQRRRIAMNKLQSLKWNEEEFWADSLSTFQPTYTLTDYSTSSSNRQTYRQTSGLSLKLTRIYPPRRQGISIEMREKRVFCISRRSYILYLTHSSLIKSVTAKTHWLSDVAFWKLSVSWRDVIPKINFLDILLSTISSTFFLFLFVRRSYYIADARTHEMRFQSRLLYYQCSSMSLSCLSECEGVGEGTSVQGM